MQEIRCPKCGEVFQVDDSGYDQIAQQVRDREFEKELDRRKKDLDAKREQELEIIRLQEEKEHTASITQKDAEISEKDQKIAELQAKLDASETAKKLAVAEAVEQKNVELSQKVTEIANLKGELKSKDTESRLNEKSLQEQYEEKELAPVTIPGDMSPKLPILANISERRISSSVSVSLRIQLDHFFSGLFRIMTLSKVGFADSAFSNVVYLIYAFSIFSLLR